MNEHRSLIPRHQASDPAIYRPQPARTGPDFWPTVDDDLVALLLYRVLPMLPPGVTIWEVAAGRGHLVDPLRRAGREVLATDLYPPPDRPDIGRHDLLHGPLPLRSK